MRLESISNTVIKDLKIRKNLEKEKVDKLSVKSFEVKE